MSHVKGLKSLSQEDDGQALAFLVIILGVIMAFAAGIYITSEIAVSKIRSQNAADAAALAGAGLLADSLDLLAYHNIIRTSSWFTPKFGGFLRAVVKPVAELVLEVAPTATHARAIQVGFVNECYVVPINHPELGVRRFGGYYQDRLWGRVGNRYVQVMASNSLQIPKSVSALLGDPYLREPMLGSISEARGIVHGRGLGLPKFWADFGKL
jgi:hypothetical protein